MPQHFFLAQIWLIEEKHGGLQVEVRLIAVRQQAIVFLQPGDS